MKLPYVRNRQISQACPDMHLSDKFNHSYGNQHFFNESISFVEYRQRTEGTVTQKLNDQKRGKRVKN